MPGDCYEYKDIVMEHIENGNEAPNNSDDAIMRCFIDGYPSADPDDERPGTVIAEVIMTKSGDRAVAWHRNDYRANPRALELVSEAYKIIESRRAELGIAGISESRPPACGNENSAKEDG